MTDSRWAVATLRRHRRVLATAAAAGLLAGVGYVTVASPQLTSTTMVLLPTPALAESSSSDVETQVRIALSATILERAGQAVAPALPARSVEKMIKVSAPTNQIIRIDATSSDAAKAKALSQAVADSYVGYVSNTAREVTSAALADLNVRRDNLQAQITQLQNEIVATRKRQQAVDPSSPDGKEEAQLLAGLRTQQANLSLQLDKVQDKIATGTPIGSAVGAGTSVVQAATEARGPSTFVRALVWAPLAALISTILAAIVLLVITRRETMRLRDDIADAVGRPVLAAVPSQPQRSVAGWSTLLESYEATPTESWAFRQLLRGLVPADRKGDPHAAGRMDHPRSLTVVSLSGDGRGLTIGPQLAAFASSQGIPTRLVAAIGHERAASLWAACATEREIAGRPGGLYLGDAPNGQAIDLTIILVVVDRMQPKLAGAPASAATILSVASATATEQELARVAIAVDDAGHRIDGIVVADPDQTDRTSGRHTMDERSRRPALPTRLTGVPSSTGTAAGRHRSRS